MEIEAAATNSPTRLADDILRGADAIGDFLFGSHDESKRKRNRRKVYYLAECTKLPVFRLGSVLCARRTVLLEWISGQELKSARKTERKGEARSTASGQQTEGHPRSRFG